MDEQRDPLQERFREGFDLRKKGRYADGLVLQEGLLAEGVGYPLRIRVFREAAKCASRMGEWAKVEALSRQVISEHPSSAQSHLDLGQALYQQGRMEEAKAAVETALQRNPELTDARTLLMVLAKKPGREGARTPRPWPTRRIDFETPEKLIRRYLLKNHGGSRFIRQDTVFTTLGSCFAENLAKRLQTAGYRVNFEAIGEEVNSTFANRFLLEWIETGVSNGPTQAMETVFGPAVRERLHKAITESDAFVMTLGVAPCFFDEETGEFAFNLVGSAAGKDHLVRHHVMRTTTVQENVDNVRRSIEIIRRLARDPQIVLTVSPVPLLGSTEFGSAITADCLSKSILRVACHEVLSGPGGEGLIYWPSFEIVRWLGSYYPADWPAYGADDENTRHVSAWLVDLIIKLFIEHHQAEEAKTESASAA